MWFEASHISEFKVRRFYIVRVVNTKYAKISDLHSEPPTNLGRLSETVDWRNNTERCFGNWLQLGVTGQGQCCNIRTGTRCIHSLAFCWVTVRLCCSGLYLSVFFSFLSSFRRLRCRRLNGFQGLSLNDRIILFCSYLSYWIGESQTDKTVFSLRRSPSNARMNQRHFSRSFFE